MDKDILSLHTLFVVNVHIFVLFLHFFSFFCSNFLYFISICNYTQKVCICHEKANMRLTEGILCSPKGWQLLTPWVRMIKSKSIFESPVVCLFLHTFLLKLHSAQISATFCSLKLWDILPGLRNLRMCLNSEVSQCNALWSSWLQHIPPTLHIEQQRISDKLLRICILQ